MDSTIKDNSLGKNHTERAIPKWRRTERDQNEKDLKWKGAVISTF